MTEFSKIKTSCLTKRKIKDLKLLDIKSSGFKAHIGVFKYLFCCQRAEYKEKIINNCKGE